MEKNVAKLTLTFIFIVMLYKMNIVQGARSIKNNNENVQSPLASPNIIGYPGFPGYPNIPGFPRIPGIPGFPRIPWFPHIPGFPLIPWIPYIPGFPRFPNIPGFPYPIPFPPPASDSAVNEAQMVQPPANGRVFEPPSHGADHGSTSP